LRAGQISIQPVSKLRKNIQLWIDLVLVKIILELLASAELKISPALHVVLPGPSLRLFRQQVNRADLNLHILTKTKKNENY